MTTVTATQDSGWPPRILVEATNVGAEVTDTFTRTVSNAWGTATSGQTWTSAGGSASDYAVASGAGTQNCTSVAVTRNMFIPVLSDDIELFTNFFFQATPTGGTVQPGLVARRADSTNMYLAEVVIGTDNSVKIQLRKDVGGTFTTLAGPTATGVTHSTSRTYAMRFQVFGTTLRARVWDGGASEPSTWTVTATDATFTDAGGVGCRSTVNTGNSNTNPTIIYDNFSANDLSATVSLVRSQNGIRTTLRASDSLVLTDTSIVRNDGEMSYGLPVTYIVVVNGVDTATSTPITPTLPGGKVALSDAITGLAAEVTITAWPDRQNDRTSTTFNLPGRTTVVSAPRAGFTSQLEVLTESESSRENLIALLDGATSNIIMLRSFDAATYQGVDGHLAVTSDDERPVVQRGSDQRRLWTLGVVESEGWASSLATSGWTYQDMTNAYLPSGTYVDLEGDYATYLDVAVWDWGSGHA